MKSLNPAILLFGDPFMNSANSTHHCPLRPGSLPCDPAPIPDCHRRSAGGVP